MKLRRGTQTDRSSIKRQQRTERIGRKPVGTFAACPHVIENQDEQFNEKKKQWEQLLAYHDPGA